MEALHTPRLDLIPLSRSELAAYLDAPTQLEQKLGLALSRAVLTPVVKRAIRMKIAKMDAVPAADHPWYTYWLVIVRTAGFGAGLTGYKGLQQVKSEIEVGYGIDPAYAGQGYTTEAVRALVDWAFQDPAVEAVITTATLKTNLASLRIQEILGFSVCGETETTLDQRLDRSAWQEQS